MAFGFGPAQKCARFYNMLWVWRTASQRPFSCFGVTGGHDALSRKSSCKCTDESSHAVNGATRCKRTFSRARLEP